MSHNVVEVTTPSVGVVEIELGRQGPPGPPGPANTQYVDDLMHLHVIDPEPHPEYDDAGSFTLIFENGLV